MRRCEWAPLDQPRYLAYHDEEWGVPVHDDVHLFEMLTLEGAQAGLSWSTILNKREGYREAFRGFDPAKVARFSPATVERLLQNPASCATASRWSPPCRTPAPCSKCSATWGRSTPTCGPSSTAPRS